MHALHTVCYLCPPAPDSKRPIESCACCDRAAQTQLGTLQAAHWQAKAARHELASSMAAVRAAVRISKRVRRRAGLAGMEELLQLLRSMAEMRDAIRCVLHSSNHFLHQATCTVISARPSMRFRAYLSYAVRCTWAPTLLVNAVASLTYACSAGASCSGAGLASAGRRARRWITQRPSGSVDSAAACSWT